MGNNHEKFFSKNKRKILVLGLSDAGKTSFSHNFISLALVQNLQSKPELANSSKQTIKMDL